MANNVVSAVYYHAVRRRGGWVEVTRRGEGGLAPLYHDPAWTGGALVDYDWGCGGAGTELLALAILSDVLGTVGLGRCWAEDYAREVVARWDTDSWVTSSHEVCAWLIHKTVSRLLRDDPTLEKRLKEKVFGPGCGGAGEAPADGKGAGNGH
jgi:hypothetical protein